MWKSLEPVRGSLAYSLLGLLLLLLLSVPFGALTEPVEGDAFGGGNADRVTYDQRQSGKYNIHVSIKDVAIIEMDQNEIEDGSYNEEEYYYDEGDLTVKPYPTRSTITTTATITNQTSSTTTTNIPLATLNSHELPSTSIPSFLLTTLHNRNYTSYSPNLMADIAATQAAHYINTLINTTAAAAAAPVTTESSSTTARRTPTPNVVILETSATTEQHSPTSTHRPTVVPVKVVAGRTKEIPVIMEPVLHPRQRLTPTTTMRTMMPAIALQEQPMPQETVEEPAMSNADSKIFKFKVRRAQKLAYPGPATYASVPQSAPLYASAGAFGRRCRSHQYRDISGNCRHKRSSSILKKLFRMLVSLPFANERNTDQSDE